MYLGEDANLASLAAFTSGYSVALGRQATCSSDPDLVLFRESFDNFIRPRGESVDARGWITILEERCQKEGCDSFVLFFLELDRFIEAYERGEIPMKD